MSSHKSFIPVNSVSQNIANLLSSGFEEYLSTFEKFTADGDANMNHVILTCTKPGHKNNGKVVDVYYNNSEAYQIVSNQ